VTLSLFNASPGATDSILSDGQPLADSLAVRFCSRTPRKIINRVMIVAPTSAHVAPTRLMSGSDSAVTNPPPRNGSNSSCL
jgi:hypothetical protein